MAIIQTLLHYGSYLAAFYAVYLLAGSLAFGLVLWQKVYGKSQRQPVPVRVRVHSERMDGRERDSYYR
ncbi:MAG: hypothetical protein QM686_20360 [Herbaspirillum sp.]|jgi:hypothetical protein|nr:MULTISPECIES: hypothetical protein [Herbaspirillum]MDR6738740.1 hypothetical protein [Herbaspirillum sp. 1173]UWE19089.1 hypothetical protein NY669_13180 [Herbaspirillum huttiense]